MNRSTSVRGSLATALSVILIVGPGSAAMVAADEHDDPDAIALRDGLASFVGSLAGLGEHPAMTEPVPLTPASVRQFLGLDEALNLLAQQITNTAGVTFDELENSLADGIQLPGGLASVSGTLEKIDTTFTINLDVALNRIDDVPIAIGTDLIGLTGGGPTLGVDVSAEATLEFDPDALEASEPLTALGVRVGTDAPVISAEAALSAAWDDDPLAANVGILAVDVTGTASAGVEASATINADLADGLLSQGTWESTSGLDLAGEDPRTGAQVPGAVVRRPAAAGGHRAGAGDEAQGDAVRRTDVST